MAKTTVRTQLTIDAYEKAKACADIYGISMSSIIDTAVKHFFASDGVSEYYPKAATKKPNGKITNPSHNSAPSYYDLNPSEKPQTPAIDKTSNCYLAPGAPEEGLQPAYYVFQTECPPNLSAQPIPEADPTSPPGYWLIPHPNTGLTSDDWSYPVYSARDVALGVEAWLAATAE